MDRRYFHGIRTTAALALSKHATQQLDWVGLFHLEKAFQELFCFPGSPMPRRMTSRIVPRISFSVLSHKRWRRFEITGTRRQLGQGGF